MNQAMMTEHEVLQMDNLQLVEAHVDTLHESSDVEAVRNSAIALLNTKSGRDYATNYPMAL